MKPKTLTVAIGLAGRKIPPKYSEKKSENMMGKGDVGGLMNRSQTKVDEGKSFGQTEDLIGKNKVGGLMDRSQTAGASAANHAQESPGDEVAFHEQGAPPRPTPVSVNFRTMAETCGRCEYFAGGQCSFLGLPVGEGDSCNRFEDKAEDVMNPTVGQEQAGQEYL